MEKYIYNVIINNILHFNQINKIDCMLQCLYCNQSEKKSKCDMNIRDIICCTLCAAFLLSSQLDIICDLLLLKFKVKGFKKSVVHHSE